MKPFSKSRRMTAGLLVLMVWQTGCSSCGGGSRDPSEALPEMVAFNEAQAGVHRGLEEYARRLLGEGGYVDRAAGLRDLDFSRADDVGRWVAEAEKMDEELEALHRIMAGATLDALEMIRLRGEIIRLRAEGFATETAGLHSQSLLGTALVLVTVGIVTVKIFQKIGDTVDGSQKVVQDMALGEPESRRAVVDALRGNGVTVPEGASGQQVAELFESQDRDTRRRVANAVREKGGQMIVDGGATGDEPGDLAVEDSQRRVDSAVQLGEVAVEAVVAGSQAVTGGAGDLIGGTAGAATDLVLTATETDPMSLVSQHVDIVVTSKETLPLEQPPPFELPVEEAKVHVEGLAAGEPGPGAGELIEAASSLWAEMLRLATQTASVFSLPARIVFTEATLNETDTDEIGLSYSGSAEVPGFSAGEAVEVIVTRAETTPQEVLSHNLGPDNPLELNSPPLLGTLSVLPSTAGPPSPESQMFDLEVHIIKVPGPTSLTCSGTNVVATQRVVPVPSEGSYQFRVEVFGAAAVRVRRTDSGESYLLALAADVPEEEEEEPPDESLTPECIEAQLHLCVNLPLVGCDIEVMDRARERVVDACGSFEAERFFAQAVGECC